MRLAHSKGEPKKEDQVGTSEVGVTKVTGGVATDIPPFRIADEEACPRRVFQAGAQYLIDPLGT